MVQKMGLLVRLGRFPNKTAALKMAWVCFLMLLLILKDLAALLPSNRVLARSASYLHPPSAEFTVLWRALDASLLRSFPHLL